VANCSKSSRSMWSNFGRADDRTRVARRIRGYSRSKRSSRVRRRASESSMHRSRGGRLAAFMRGEMELSGRGGRECGTVAAIAGSVNGAAGLAGCFDLLVSPYVRFRCLFVFFGAADLAFMLFFEAFIHKSRIRCPTHARLGTIRPHSRFSHFDSHVVGIPRAQWVRVGMLAGFNLAHVEMAAPGGRQQLDIG
jgi:hypothetical protein